MGPAAAKLFPATDLPAYMAAQTAGAIAAEVALYFIASARAGFDLSAGMASNGYGAHLPGGYTLIAGFTAEVLLTFTFVMIILGFTDSSAPKGFAPIAISRA